MFDPQGHRTCDCLEHFATLQLIWSYSRVILKLSNHILPQTGYTILSIREFLDWSFFQCGCCVVAHVLQKQVCVLIYGIIRFRTVCYYGYCAD